MTFDNKIELNHEINQTLEQIAQAIFKSWFVDFEPVKAKIEAKQNGQDPERAAMCTISGKTDAELDAFLEASTSEQRQRLTATAALFPDEFQESEFGPIPKGWEVKFLGQILSRIAMGPFGSNIRKDNFIESGVPVIRGGNLTDGLVEVGYVFVSEEKANQLKNSNAFPEDIVITHRGTLGQVAIIPKNSMFPRYVVSQSQMVLTVDKEKVLPRFVHEFLVSKEGQHLILSNRSQVGVPAIARPTNSLKSIPLVVPDITILRAFDANTQWMYSTAVENTRMNKTLSEMRDVMLPKLLSGEIALTDAA